MKLRHSVIFFAFALVAIVAFGLFMLLRKAPVLTAVSWAGAYGRAQTSALFIPYALRSGVDVHLAQYDGGLDQLRRRVKTGSYGWDVIDLELPDAVAACREGLLEHVDVRTLLAGPHGEPAARDFIANAIGPCWVGSVVYSQVIAFMPGHFGSAPPVSAEDFFDVAKFPGSRALRSSSPKLNLELALLADHVPPDKIYKVLSSPEGVNRALAKLATLGTVAWWTRSADAVRMLADGRAAMATVLNGDVYDAAAKGPVLQVIWDRQLYEMDVFGVPKGDPKSAMAFDFVRFATTAPSLAQVADWVPYGPARRSALESVTRNPESGRAMTPYLPTAPQHFKTAFAVDDAWWLSHVREVMPVWQRWQSSTNR
ncbi:MAG: extracellular solute-binding protein [Alphaproteobacteria bacterium]|nr:extracellular solute-binding protein [Alphaproteobacteria bacterium]MBV9695112.1 extracellular solute-binding protein [Alphaproteobacteria bacterium]